jgi:hypothetical protein
VAEISGSKKLHHAAAQWIVSSGRYILFRVIWLSAGATVMTATAGEDDGSYLSYPDQEALIAATRATLNPERQSVESKWDRAGRPYLEVRNAGTLEDVVDVANIVIRTLKLVDSAELVRAEGRQIYDGVAGHDPMYGPLDPYEDAVYMSDGLWLTPDGEWIRR